MDSIGWPDFSGDSDEHVAQWRSWLRQVWRIEEFAAAVETASPVLARQVRAVCGEPHRPEAEVRRAVVSVARYLVRATGRATPFGLFAGVAGASFDRATTVRWGRQHQAVARIDADWLETVLTQLEADPQVRERLLVMANSAATVRDGRLVLGGWPRASGRTTPGERERGEVSVRNTRAVQALMRAAATPIRVCEAAEQVAAELDAPATALEPMLTGLVEQGLLITQLRPPMTATDPLAHIVAALDEAEADTAAGAAEHLRALHRDTVAGTHSPPRQACDHSMRISHAAAELAASERPVGMDLRLDCDLALPQTVAREAETAAEALVRVSPQPFGTPEWQQYHSRFVERYGPHAVVPLPELVADTGLGVPAGYRESHWPAPADSSMSERDTTLMTWAQRAAWQRRREIVLDDHALAELDVTGGANILAQPHTELRVRVQATSRAALERGEFELAVVGASRAAGTTTGRVGDLVGDEHRRAYATLSTLCENALPVQVCAPARYARTDNVARSPQLLPTVISLGEHRDPSTTLPLEDLAVTADADRFTLISLSRQCPVEPLVFNAVEMVQHAHPLVRFLAELSTARAAPCAPFSWGQASRLPYLPRLRYGRTILAPARWRLEASDLPDPTSSWPTWLQGLQQWCQHAEVPDTVYVGETDRRMRLHLHITAHAWLLRAELDRTGRLTLREAPADDAFGWFDGHAHELTIPLGTSTPQTSAPRWSPHPVSREHGHLPGSGTWVYVKLYGHPDRQSTVLTDHLPELLSTWDSAPEWWFLRYHDPEPHLRLRFRVHDQDAAARLVAQISTWIAALRERGLVGRAQFDTYYPETGRFGTGAAMAAAESVFAADSRAALVQLGMVECRDGIPAPALTAASMVHLACAAHTDPADGLRWLIETARVPSGPAPDRRLRATAVQLADPREDWAAVRTVPGGDDLAVAWRKRRQALADYRRALQQVGGPKLTSLLADLLHLHHARMTGPAPEAERACLRLARAAALSWNARTQGATQ